MRRNQVAINISQLASSIENEFSHDLCTPSQCCIFETPKILFRHNPKAYIPNAFSIGPFHHRNPFLTSTEKIKYKYLQGLISRCPETSLIDLLQAIGAIEKKARACYAGEVDCTVDEFVKMLVVDGCFLIEHFRKYSGLVPTDTGDPISTMSCNLQFLFHDLILLENQIPLIVLEILFNMTKEDDSTPLVELVIKFFEKMFSATPASINLIQSKNHKHILDLLRNWLVAPLSEGEKTVEWQTLPSATSIKDSGIKFKKVNKNTNLHVEFRNGVLEMPSLLIQETTETIFRNLISFEQCYPKCPPIVTSYAILLDNLINTTEDMHILCEEGIIDNWVNPDDATQFFNRLYHDAFVKDFYYWGLCQEVNKYCKRRLPRWRAAYMHNYFGTPWAIASQIVAAILLILTFLQTFYSVKQGEQGNQSGATHNKMY